MRSPRPVGGPSSPDLLRVARSTSAARARVDRAIDGRGEEVVRLCRELIRVPSQDPPGDGRPIRDLLVDYLVSHDLRPTTHAPDERRPNLVARIDLAGPGPNVVFNGHLDTLPAGDPAKWTVDPFSADLIDGWIYGRGARCMKGGIAALITAALVLRDHVDCLGGALTLALASDEVNGGAMGTGYLLDNVPEVRGDVALIGEGGPWINFAHKGVLFAEFQVNGRAGHGAYGFAATSAIHGMVELLEELRKLEEFPVAVPSDIRERLDDIRAITDAEYGPGATDALSRMSVNVGTIRGGVKVNVVADVCTAQVDFRLPHGMRVADLLAKIHEAVDAVPGATFRTLWTNEPTASRTDDPWFQVLQRDSREVFGRALPFVYTHGFTDARFFRLRDIPAAGIAPNGRNVGAPDECIEVESLRAVARFIALATFDHLASSAPSSTA